MKTLFFWNSTFSSILTVTESYLCNFPPTNKSFLLFFDRSSDFLNTITPYVFTACAMQSLTKMQIWWPCQNVRELENRDVTHSRGTSKQKTLEVKKSLQKKEDSMDDDWFCSRFLRKGGFWSGGVFRWKKWLVARKWFGVIWRLSLDNNRNFMKIDRSERKTRLCTSA